LSSLISFIIDERLKVTKSSIDSCMQDIKYSLCTGLWKAHRTNLSLLFVYEQMNSIYSKKLDYRRRFLGKK